MIDGIINCMAVDDEPLALSVISSFCERKGGMRLKSFTDPEAALMYASQNRPDIVFLDIEMDQVSGLELAGKLPRGCCVIFTTAFVQYAIDGYDLGVVDFLHKPFSYDRFSRAVDKARIIIGYVSSQSGQQVIMVKEDYANVPVPLSEILYVEAMNNYSRIFRTGDVCTSSRMSLKSLMDMLPSEGFLKIHRSFIVSIDKVVGFSRSEVRLVGGRTLPVGRQFARDVYGCLGRYGAKSHED